MFYNIFKNLEYSRFSHTFVGELTMRTSIKVFIIAAAFFMPAQDSKGCFFSSGSRCKALLTFANIREKQSFYILKHFYPTMRTSVKNASRLSITPQSTPAGETGTLHSGKPAETLLLSKKVCKKFADSKTCRTFATSIPQTIFLASKSVAVFFATKLGYQIPLGCCTLMSVIVCGRTGGDSLSIFKHFNFFVQ